MKVRFCNQSSELFCFILTLRINFIFFFFFYFFKFIFNCIGFYHIVLVSTIHLAFKNMMNKVRDVIADPRNQRAQGDTLPNAVFSERPRLPPGPLIAHLPLDLAKLLGQYPWWSFTDRHPRSEQPRDLAQVPAPRWVISPNFLSSALSTTNSYLIRGEPSSLSVSPWQLVRVNLMQNT